MGTNRFGIDRIEKVPLKEIRKHLAMGLNEIKEWQSFNKMLRAEMKRRGVK